MLEPLCYFIAGACCCAFGTWLGWNTFGALCGALEAVQQDSD